jgi:hypothetical protein
MTSHQPADRTLPDLAHVRDIENPDPAPVADVPDQTFDLTPPPETTHTAIRLCFEQEP